MARIDSIGAIQMDSLDKYIDSTDKYDSIEIQKDIRTKLLESGKYTQKQIATFSENQLDSMDFQWTMK